MAPKVWFKTIEDFRGLNYKPSSLTKDEFFARELVNYRTSEGKSLVGVEGFRWIGQKGVGYGLHNYVRLNRDTGATEETLITCNDALFALKSDSLVVTRTGGSATVSIRMVYSSGNISFQIIQNSVTVLDRIVYNGGTGAHYTVWELAAEIDALANFSCALPDASGIASNGATNYQLAMNASHTITAHDVIPIYDNVQKRLIGRRVKQIVAGPEIQFWNQEDGVSVSASTVIGRGAASAATFELENTTSGIFSSQTLTYYYWQPVVQAYTPIEVVSATTKEFGLPSFKGWYADIRTINEGQFPAFQNCADIVTVGAESLETNYVDNYQGSLLKYDGQNCHRLGLPSPSTTFGTAVSAGGTLTGTFKYIERFKHEDAQGNIIYSRPSAISTASPAGQYVGVSAADLGPRETIGTTNIVQAGVTTLNLNLTWFPDFIKVGSVVRISSVVANAPFFRIITGYNNTAQTITFEGAITTGAAATVVNWDFGYPMKYARVNGAQAGVSSITVDTPHMFEVGDLILINPATTSGVGDRAVKTPRKFILNAVTGTTIAWDANIYGIITVVDNEIISNGTSVEIFRTTNGGNEFYFLAEIPVGDDSTIQLYRDNISDVDLGFQFIDQPFGEEFDPIGRASYVATHQGCLVAKTEPNSLRWSLPGEYEYFPLATNQLDVPSNISGDITGFISDKDSRLAIFKPNAHYSLEGDITVPGGASVITVSEGDYGVSSHNSLNLVKGLIFGVGPIGIMTLQGTEYIPDIGDPISPFILNNTYLTLAKAFSINDYEYREFSISIPNYFGSFTNNPRIYSFDYWANPRWLERRYGEDFMRGGAAMHQNKLYVISHDYDNVDIIGDYCYVRRTRAATGAETTVVPSNLVGSTVLSNIFTPQWFHGGEPSLYKSFIRMVVWSMPGDFEDRSPFSLTVTGYRDFDTTNTYDSFTFDFTTTTTLRSIAHLLTTKSLSFSPKMTCQTAGYIPFITGFELIVAPIYGKDDILP